MSRSRPERSKGRAGADAGAASGGELGVATRSAERSVWSIGELARELEITTRAIRFYESKGLLAPPGRVGGTRSYGRRERARLILILRGKNLGFSLEEIGEYLALYDADPAQQAQIRHLLAKVEGAIADLTRKRADLDRTLVELGDIHTKARAALEGTGHPSPVHVEHGSAMARGEAGGGGNAQVERSGSGQPPAPALPHKRGGRT